MDCSNGLVLAHVVSLVTGVLPPIQSNADLASFVGVAQLCVMLSSSPACKDLPQFAACSHRCLRLPLLVAHYRHAH